MWLRHGLVLAALSSACASGGPGSTGDPGPSGMDPGQFWLLVADRDADQILRYDAASGAFVDLVASGTEIGAAGPSSVRMGPDGLLYVIGFARATVARFDLAARSPAGVFYQDSRVLEEPVELLFRQGDLVVLGNDTRNAVIVAPDGALSSDFGYPDMRAAHDLLLAPDGLLYVGIDSHPALGTAIQVWDPERGARVRDFAGLGEIASATGLALGPDGLLYACDSYRDQVVSFDPATGRVAAVLVAPGSGILEGPASLDFAPDGSLYVVDELGVAVIDPRTGELLSRLLAVGDGHLVRPRSLTFVSAATLPAPG